ncbi:hypothetical protein Tco_1380151 [Tanacetum coccineum]
MVTLNEYFPQGTDSGSGLRCQDTILGDAEAQIRFEAASKKSNDPPLSRVNTLGIWEDNMKLKELIEFCIIDFLNASSIKYALTVNPTVYESCIQQFWATAKAKIVNGERQIQALVDKKKVIIIEKSVRSDLMLEDADGTQCLPNDVIFEQFTLMGTIAWNEFSITMASAIICLATNQKFNFSKYIFDNMMKNLEGGVKFLMYPRFVQVFLDKQVERMSKHDGIYVTPSHTKNIFANMKREGKGFSGRITPLFQTMMVQAPEDMGEDSAAPTDSYSTPIVTQPSSSKPQKKKFRRKQRKDNGLTEPIPDEEPISTPSCDPPQSGEDRLQLAELMILFKQLEQRKKSRTSWLKRLRKVSLANRVESSNDVSLGAQEDASKQGRKIADFDADEEVTLIDETQERYDEEMLFDVQDDLQAKDKGKGKMVEPENPLKKKDQIALDEELALKLQAEEQAELEKERVAQEEASRAANIEKLDSIQAMIDADE